MKIGLYGGSFDPVHLGHVKLCEYFFRTLSLDKVFVIPAFVSPFKVEKPPKASEHDRYEMLKLAFKDFSCVEVSPFEIHNKGISYTIDTVKHFIKRYPKDEIYLLLAKDLESEFPKWKNSQELKSLVKIEYGPMIEPINSTMVRERLLKNESCKEILSPKVLDYIEKLHLYSL
jgi:nicotinate-nucleotide adenylyltransferase